MVGNQPVKTLLGSPSLAGVLSCGKGVFAYSRFKSSLGATFHRQL
ncbi:MAG: hypothetical protein OXK17_01425 [Thaumarchaeota archaeon]|nr:hypothetical protein [Nitrososphaerota archaeon]